MLLDTRAMRGTPLASFFVGRQSWNEFRVNARLKLEKDVDWIAVRGPSLDPREDIVVAHLAVQDDAMDRILARDADPFALAIPGVSVWSWHGLPNGRVVFRSRPNTLGTGPLSLLVSRDAIAQVVDLATEQGPLASITVHRTDRIRGSLPPKLRELRVTIEGTADGGAEVKAAADFDDADGAAAAREKLAGWVDAARARDANAAAALRPLEVTTRGPSARAHLLLTADALKGLLEWLEHAKT
jgi:hypothetical protein